MMNARALVATGRFIKYSERIQGVRTCCLSPSKYKTIQIHQIQRHLSSSSKGARRYVMTEDLNWRVEQWFLCWVMKLNDSFIKLMQVLPSTFL